MATKLTTKAAEQGTIVINAAFTDEDSASVVPDTLSWSLFNASGGVVNSRSAVSIGTPAANVDIALTGDDLDLSDGKYRYLLISGTYTSSLGTLNLREQASFEILDFVGLT